MKRYRMVFALLLLLGFAVSNYAIVGCSSVYIVKLYSQNEKYYLISVPYDEWTPTLPGKTSVYRSGEEKPIYVVDRSFDVCGNVKRNELTLSDDGEIILYVNPFDADENNEASRSVTIYKNGTLVKSFTDAEITGCNYNKERCGVEYLFKDIVNLNSSLPARSNLTQEQERFLEQFDLFCNNDKVYLTDTKANVHIFDLTKPGEFITKPLDGIFEELITIGRTTKKEFVELKAPGFGNDFPKLRDGRQTEEVLADYLGMRTERSLGKKQSKYKTYGIWLDATLTRDGSIEVSFDLDDVDPIPPKERILAFFKENRFDPSMIPLDLEKWVFRDKYFIFANKDIHVARHEMRQQERDKKIEFKRRQSLQEIGGIYIPKDLHDCFLQLDKDLPEVDKQEMKNLPHRSDMIGQYHFGLGLWMRNNWGLWGGSRLQKYFADKGIKHPDNMSSVILEYYYDWLNGDKESWKEWEKKPRS